MHTVSWILSNLLLCRRIERTAVELAIAWWRLLGVRNESLQLVLRVRQLCWSAPEGGRVGGTHPQDYVTRADDDGEANSKRVSHRPCFKRRLPLSLLLVRKWFWNVSLMLGSLVCMLPEILLSTSSINFGGSNYFMCVYVYVLNVQLHQIPFCARLISSYRIYCSTISNGIVVWRENCERNRWAWLVTLYLPSMIIHWLET